MASCRTPSQSVVQAVSVPTFHHNHEQFWKMLHLLFTQYKGKLVHTQLDTDTFRKIICQLHQVIESTEEYDVILKNGELIFHVYFVALASIRGIRTNSEMHCYESPTVLKSLYQTYRLLFKMKRTTLPGFGHPLKK